MILARGRDQLGVGIDPEHVVADRVQIGRMPPRPAPCVEDPGSPRNHRVDQPRLTHQIGPLGGQRAEALDIPPGVAWAGVGRPAGRGRHTRRIEPGKPTRPAASYHARVETLVLTVIGDDRAGLVKALADTVADGGGNWERSQLAELAGKFAGIVVVTVPEDKVEALRTALAPLAGLLDVSVHTGRGAPDATTGQSVRLEILGNDRPGIVRDVSGVLAAHDLSVASLTTGTRDAPMAGGVLFEATVLAHAPIGSDPAVVRAALEQLAGEMQVDITLDPA